MAFNNKNDQYKLRNTNNTLLQSMKSYNITPNASVDYTYTFRNPKFKIRSFSSYSYMFLTAEDVFHNIKLQDFWEHTFRQDMYLNGSLGKFEFNAGITFDYSTSHKTHYFYVDPHILLGYEIKGHKFSIRYDQNTSRPLSGQLAGITKQENEGIDITGNPLSDPPIEVVKLGSEAIKRYFEKKKKEETGIIHGCSVTDDAGFSLSYE